VTPLLAIALYMALQFGIGVWVSRRIRTESDYILAGRNLGYVLTTFSIFATWFGAETIVGSAGRAYRDGISLGSAEPFGYGLCLFLAGLVFARPLWRRGLTTLADLYTSRFSPGAERLAAIVLIPGSVYWAAAQIRAFGYVLTTSSSAIDVELAIAIAAGFTILYSVFGGMLVDAITDVIQGVILAVGLVIVFLAVLPHLGAPAAATPTLSPGIHLVPRHESVWTLLERWAIPIAGSVLATELVGRLLAARTEKVASRSSLMAGAMYVGIGAIPLVIGLFGPRLAPGLADPEQLLPHIARDLLPTFAYAVFAGALISAILSTVDSTLLTASSLLSHNILVPALRVSDERRKVLLARAGVMAFGVIAYVLARHAEGVFALVEQASSFGSAGALVTASFGLFTRFGGARAAIAALSLSPLVYVAAALGGAETPFLLSLAVAFASYVLVGIVERRLPSPPLPHAERPTGFEEATC
jgi:Na+/proline symporter